MDYHDFYLIIGSDIPEPPKELNPYQKLFLAILMDAVETLKRPPKAIVNRYIGKRQYKAKVGQTPLDPIGDAYDWLMSDCDRILGFVSICEYFNWDPGEVRKRALEAIKKAKAMGAEPGNLNRHLALPGPRSRKWGKHH